MSDDTDGPAGGDESAADELPAIDEDALDTDVSVAELYDRAADADYRSSVAVL
jgi:hypothetical protein